MDAGLEPLDICPVCLAGTSYRFDFDKRCCRARHTLMLDGPMREAHYALLEEIRGKAFAGQHRADVETLSLAGAAGRLKKVFS